MRKHTFVTILIVCLVTLPSLAWGWDLYYDGSVMPNDSTLGSSAWDVYTGNDLSQCASDGSTLHVVDSRTDASAYFYKSSVPGHAPLTVEARVRVASGTGTALDVGTSTFRTYLQLYIDHIDAAFAPLASVSYPVDVSQFRTIRVAIDAAGQSYVWIDGILMAQGTTSMGNQGDVSFGSKSESGVSDSYWDYVAYSKAFLAVPEPSSFAVVGGSLAALGGCLLSRKRCHQPAA